MGIHGKFPSAKTGQQVAYGSPLERDLLYYLDYEQYVRHYEVMPLPIDGGVRTGAGNDHRQIHRRASAFRVTLWDGETISKVLVQCYPATLLSEPGAQRELAAIRAWADDNSYCLVTVTDIDLRSGHKLDNLKLLWRYSRHPVPSVTALRCAALVGAADEMPLIQVAASTVKGGPPTEGLATVYSLLFRHVLAADLHEPLTPQSTLWLPAPLPQQRGTRGLGIYPQADEISPLSGSGLAGMGQDESEREKSRNKSAKGGHRGTVTL
ncbi:MAG: hypothetical protein IVW55_01105 [Chloroflexi bacterium]|nr:hypothetical protein [Chloroflexota bacterium]